MQTSSEAARSHPNGRPGPDELSFYIAASDRDMLAKINQLLGRSGCVGVMDTAGRLHYLIDGRRGVPYASRRILETAGRILCDRQDARSQLLQLLFRVVDRVLSDHGIRAGLKGYQYLRFILLTVGQDETQLKPVSKRLYPLVAEHFRVRVTQVERDIRYALKVSDLYRQGLTPTTAICRLNTETARAVEQEQLQLLEAPDCPDEKTEQARPLQPYDRPEGSLVSYDEPGHSH